VPIVAVMLLNAGPAEIGLLSTAQTLPFLLLSIPMGVLADRWSRSRLMVLAETLRALSLLALWLLVGGGALSLAALAVLGFVGAAGTVGFTIAAPALVPALVPPAALARANARLELARSAAFAAGPALAGSLVAWAGASLAFACATVLSTLAVLLLLRLPTVPRTAGPARHVLDELRDGAGLVWRDRLLRPVMWTAVVWNVAWLVLQAAYVPYAMRTLALSADAVGMTLGCYGAGMLIGAVLATRCCSGPGCRCSPRWRWQPRCGGPRLGWRRCRSCCSAPGRWCGRSAPPRCARRWCRCGCSVRCRRSFSPSTPARGRSVVCSAA
jgi:MFS family permease